MTHSDILHAEATGYSSGFQPAVFDVDTAIAELGEYLNELADMSLAHAEEADSAHDEIQYRLARIVRRGDKPEFGRQLKFAAMDYLIFKYPEATKWEIEQVIGEFKYEEFFDPIPA